MSARLLTSPAWLNVSAMPFHASGCFRMGSSTHALIRYVWPIVCAASIARVQFSPVRLGDRLRHAAASRERLRRHRPEKGPSIHVADDNLPRMRWPVLSSVVALL